MTAVMSPCGLYRYRLARQWAVGSGALCWVMLNPSTADAELDDPTIRKVVGFSQRFGYRAAEVVNLYAYRATDPRDLRDAAGAGIDIVGPDTDWHLADALDASDAVVAAWGAHEPPGSRRVAFLGEALRRAGARCLGRTKMGQPRHPLMVAYCTPLEAWQ